MHEAVRTERRAANPALDLEQALLPVVWHIRSVFGYEPRTVIAPRHALGCCSHKCTNKRAAARWLVQRMNLAHVRAKVLDKAQETLAHALGLLGQRRGLRFGRIFLRV